MQIVDKIVIKFFSKKIGKDELGNTYYESYSQDYLGRKKRTVIYKGLAEPTKIPSEWHSWIHFLNDNIPKTHQDRYNWQKFRQPNHTGSKSDNINNGWIKKDSYIKWQPK